MCVAGWVLMVMTSLSTVRDVVMLIVAWDENAAASRGAASDRVDGPVFTECIGTTQVQHGRGSCMQWVFIAKVPPSCSILTFCSPRSGWRIACPDARRSVVAAVAAAAASAQRFSSSAHTDSPRRRQCCWGRRAGWRGGRWMDRSDRLLIVSLLTGRWRRLRHRQRLTFHRRHWSKWTVAVMFFLCSFSIRKQTYGSSIGFNWSYEVGR